MATFDEIITLAQEYMHKDNLILIDKAYTFALEKYKDIPDRLSGEPYITHPLTVSKMIASMKLDVHTLIAGLLHRTLRGDQPLSTVAEISKLFGKDVAMIISGATKINEVQFKSRLDYKAENAKKMLLAMSKDIRVLLLKFADHLHDMKTVNCLEAERQREMAQDTMDLYAPLASRLGIDWIKREFEDLGFQYLHPREYANLSGKIETSLQEREEFVKQIKSVLIKELEKNDIKDAIILGRPKHLYSIYRKLVAQNIPVEKVYDKVAFRVILHSVSECYEVMGIVHSLWKPIASRFKDFIGTPKANMYQSLHTSVIGPHGDFMEIQIRTEEMDQIANDGIAAHWAYKEGSKSISQKDASLFHWLKQLVKGLQEVEDSKEFLETVKDELDHSEVYVLTPAGDVKELPIGSSPLDFAYAIHTEVGNHCIGAKIEGKIVPLKYQIKSGDVIEILTSKNQTPNGRWMSLVKTSRAKNRIRHWLKQEEQEEFLEKGREICERELRKNNLNLKKIIKTGHFKTLLKALSCNSLDDLMRHVGSGTLPIATIIDELEPPEVKEEKLKQAELDRQKKLEKTKKTIKKRNATSPFKVAGIDDMLVKVSNCCMPMPGDDVVGFITAGRGVTVHKSSCKNLLATDPHRHVDVEWNDWASGGQTTHKSKIQVIVHDRKGMLVSVCNVINGDDADILDVEAHTYQANSQAKIDLTLAVRDREHLSTILNQIRQMDGILEARRV